MPKSDKQIEEDPFLLLGYGVNSYFNIMLDLMWMNICITIFLLPLMYFYSVNDQLALKGHSAAKYALDQFTLGNMGGSHVQCVAKSSA